VPVIVGGCARSALGARWMAVPGTGPPELITGRWPAALPGPGETRSPVLFERPQRRSRSSRKRALEGMESFMPNWIRRPARLASAAGLLVIAMVAAATATASASTARPHAAWHRSSGSVLPVNLTADGFTVPGPNPRPAGPVTFQVTTPDATGHYFYTARLRGSTTIQEVEHWSAEVNSPVLSVELAAAQNLYKWVDYTGGVAVYPATPASMTIGLTPGTYYLFDTPAFSDSASLPSGADAMRAMAASMAAPSDLNSLQVTAGQGGGTGIGPQHIDGVIHLVMRNGKPGYDIFPSTLPSDGTFLIRNDITQPAQAVFRQVAPGTTDAEIQAYFNALLAGGPTPPDPLTTSPGGITTISPGDSAIVHLDFPAATYAVLSFLEDPTNGIHLAYEGMHKIVVMH
jgi:hypothetical protein